MHPASFIKPLYFFIIFTIFIVTNVLAADYTEPLTGVTFVYIQGGSFDMGDLHGHGHDIERPARKVYIDDFYMSKTEITFAQYDLFCEKTNRVKPDDNGWGRGKQPVINVSYEDAADFAEWLSKTTGKTIRLPSEAEWEYAARAGRNSEFWWGDEAGMNNANCKDCVSRWSGEQPAPVASFKPNPFGLYDMNGNVYEWCADDYHVSYKGAPPDGRPWTGGDSLKEKVMRSGSFAYHSFESRSRARSSDHPNNHNFDYGVRLVMEL